MKEIKVNEYWLKLYKQLENAVEDFVLLFDYWKTGDASEEETKEAFQSALSQIEEAEFKSTLNKPEDELPAVLQINPGAVVQKAKTGQRCCSECIACMERSKDGK